MIYTWTVCDRRERACADKIRRTMRCNGVGLARFYEWKIKRPDPLIATVLPLNQHLNENTTRRQSS
jgi:hypothetical protein